MSRIYFYKLVVDNGGAPCVQDRLLSLALCKPAIRKSAEPGDLLFGFAASSLARDNRLIYVAEITEAVRDGSYYRGRLYWRRRDCIYEWRDDRFALRHKARYHTLKDMKRDLGAAPGYDRADVLLSNDFRYFGREGKSDYKDLFPRIKEAVERLGPGSRIDAPEQLRQEFLALKENLWSEKLRKVAGEPSGPARGNEIEDDGYYGEC